MTSRLAPDALGGFRHEALLYGGLDGFLDATLPFVRAGLEAGEPVLVAVSVEKIDALRAELAADAGHVVFEDMAEVGANPAWIIPLWHRFVEQRCRPGAPVRGVGEPIWPGRTAVELAECQRHEALVDVAFVDGPPWWLACPYDTHALAPEVLDEAQRAHPYVARGGATMPSPVYRPFGTAAGPYDAPFPESTRSRAAGILRFDAGALDVVRRHVARAAVDAGLDPSRIHDLAVAAHEIASNSVAHGGGEGAARIWLDDEALVCEIRDRGWITDPLVGRRHPDRHDVRGRGVWMANRLCDLVQLRTAPNRTTVRLHMVLRQRT